MTTFGKVNCAACNKEFEKNTYNQPLCSKECKQILKNIRRKKGETLKNCCICGKEFEACNTRKTCSEECKPAVKK